MSRRPLLLVAALGAVLMSTALPGFSAATFTATSTSVGTIGAAADWTPPTVSMPSPSGALSGSVELAATALDGAGESGLARVTIAYRAFGADAWVELCTTTAAPFSCTWDTRGVADGDYELRAAAVDRAGHTASSAPVRATVANRTEVPVVRGADVQAGNGDGLLQRGDSITFTYSGQVALDTLAAGWNGSDRSVTVRVADSAGRATLAVFTSASMSTPVGLGSVDLRAAYLKPGKEVSVPAQMRADSVVGPGGTLQTVVTVVLKEPHPSGLVEWVSTSPVMRWSPSSVARALSGAAVSPAEVDESGSPDKDF